MASRKNKWRGRKGAVQFRRETKRYHDGTPWGIDVLYVRIAGKACAVVEPFDWKAVAPGKTLSVLLGTYHAAAPAQAAHMIRDYLKREASNA